MYIHLGQDVSVLLDDVIGIFDMDTSTISRKTQNYLNQAQKNGEIISITDDLPKTFIVCRDPMNVKSKIIYLSQISSATLLKRANMFNNYGSQFKIGRSDSDESAELKK